MGERAGAGGGQGGPSKALAGEGGGGGGKKKKKKKRARSKSASPVGNSPEPAASSEREASPGPQGAARAKRPRFSAFSEQPPPHEEGPSGGGEAGERKKKKKQKKKSKEGKGGTAALEGGDDGGVEEDGEGAGRAGVTHQPAPRGAGEEGSITPPGAAAGRKDSLPKQPKKKHGKRHAGAFAPEGGGGKGGGAAEERPSSGARDAADRGGGLGRKQGGLKAPRKPPSQGSTSPRLAAKAGAGAKAGPPAVPKLPSAPKRRKEGGGSSPREPIVITLDDEEGVDEAPRKAANDGGKGRASPRGAEGQREVKDGGAGAFSAVHLRYAAIGTCCGLTSGATLMKGGLQVRCRAGGGGRNEVLSQIVKFGDMVRVLVPEQRLPDSSRILTINLADTWKPEVSVRAFFPEGERKRILLCFNDDGQFKMVMQALQKDASKGVCRPYQKAEEAEMQTRHENDLASLCNGSYSTSPAKAPAGRRGRSDSAQTKEGAGDDMHAALCVFPPDKSARDSVTVTRSDLLTLQPEEFLNDTIMDFYLKYVQSSISPHQRDQCHFFSTYFWKKLTSEATPEASHAAVAKWSNSVDLFQKRFIFVPICNRLHWTLAIVCNPAAIVAPEQGTGKDGDGGKKAGKAGKEAKGGGKGKPQKGDIGAERDVKFVLLYLDSLGGFMRACGVHLFSYLKQEYMVRKMTKEEAALIVADTDRADAFFQKLVCKRTSVPKQRNASDCGIYVLEYVQRFVTQFVEEDAGGRAARDLAEWLTGDNSRRWFKSKELDLKRREILSLIKQCAASFATS